jgi:predicted HD phosphohydrolase
MVCLSRARDLRRADNELVVAALLHDIGYLVAGESDAIGCPSTIRSAPIILRKLGGSEWIADVVSGHVAAKRYLMAVKPAYYGQLSETSRQRLAIEGGPMSRFKT